MPHLGTRLQTPPEPRGIPRVSGWLLSGFAHYTRWYLNRHFHSLRIASSGWLPDNESAIPKVIFLNHASWWDPLVCLHLSRTLFVNHQAYAPIDAKAVEKYAFFKRLGFFGIEPDSPRGAARFFRISCDILANPWTILWVTPQGRFADVRERPVRFKNGLGHLAYRIGHSRTILHPPPQRVQFVPLAIEYTHWHERLPEILIRFGQPIDIATDGAHPLEPDAWTRRLEENLEDTMQNLAAESQLRQPDAFLPLLRGQSGVGGIYDLWRRFRAWTRRQPFNPNHGNL